MKLFAVVWAVTVTYSGAFTIQSSISTGRRKGGNTFSPSPWESTLSVSKTTLGEPDSMKKSRGTEPPVLKHTFPSMDADLTILPNEAVANESPVDTKALALGATALTLLSTAAVSVFTDLSPGDLVSWTNQLIAHPQDTLQAGVDAVQAMGPKGALVFGLIYLVAEVLAVPATPLTLSAGYLFGAVQGTAIVLLAATAAACVAFFVGKTFLRTWVEDMLQENPKFAKLDKAIGKEGFKLLLLVRLSPIFPFALSNYLYGASSIDFASYFWATLLGFAPGTVAYVYTGMVGKALTLGGGSSEPWYVYAGGLGLLSVFVKLASDVASNIVNAIEDDE